MKWQFGAENQCVFPPGTLDNGIIVCYHLNVSESRKMVICLEEKE